jgi:hypothetical protein
VTALATEPAESTRSECALGHLTTFVQVWPRHLPQGANAVTNRRCKAGRLSAGAALVLSKGPLDVIAVGLAHANHAGLGLTNFDFGYLLPSTFGARHSDNPSPASTSRSGLDGVDLGGAGAVGGADLLWGAGVEGCRVVGWVDA